jgi:hypothetical protein
MFDRSAAQLADFQSMAVQPFSEMTYWSGLSLQQLGRTDEATALFEGMKSYALALESRPATIDYFATSLPTLLLFEEDLNERQKIQSGILHSLAVKGLAQRNP